MGHAQHYLSATFMHPIVRSQLKRSMKLVSHIESVLNQSVLFVKKTGYRYLTPRMVEAKNFKLICFPNPTILSILGQYLEPLPL